MCFYTLYVKKKLTLPNERPTPIIYVIYEFFFINIFKLFDCSVTGKNYEKT